MSHRNAGTDPEGGVARPQRTIGQAVSTQGICLHSGRHVSMTLRSGAAGSGVVFRRIDRRGAEIAASWRNVRAAPLCTALDNGAGLRVLTVEHLLCALRACEVDNVVVELDGDEVPIFDGSARPLVDLVLSAGVLEQALPLRCIRIARTVEIREGQSRLALAPAPAFTVDVTLTVPGWGLLRWCGAAPPAVIRREIAPARTFGRLTEALPAMLLARLAGRRVLRGAWFSCALVIHRRRVLNRGGLRFPDELARHRALDAIGDLALAGAPIIGAFTAHRPSHRLNHRLLQALFADDGAWSWTVRAARI